MIKDFYLDIASLPDEIDAEYILSDKLPFTDRKKSMIKLNKDYYTFDHIIYMPSYINMFLLTCKYYKSRDYILNNITNTVFFPYKFYFSINDILYFDNLNKKQIENKILIGSQEDYYLYKEKLENDLNITLKYNSNYDVIKNYNNYELYIVDSLEKESNLVEMVVKNLCCSLIYIYSPILETTYQYKELKELGTLFNYNLEYDKNLKLYKIKRKKLNSISKYIFKNLANLDYTKIFYDISLNKNNYINNIKNKNLVEFIYFLINNYSRKELN